MQGDEVAVVVLDALQAERCCLGEIGGPAEVVVEPFVALGDPAAVGGVGERPAGAAFRGGVEFGRTGFATTGEIPAGLTRAGILAVALSGC
jgi:hypothetical protein